MNDLFTRLFLNFRTSADGVVLTVIAWLSSNGFDVSTARKDQILGWVAIGAAAIWKFFSKDPVRRANNEASFFFNLDRGTLPAADRLR